MADLFEILESPIEYEHHRFVIDGYIFGLSNTKFKKVTKKMDYHTKKMYYYFLI